MISKSQLKYIQSLGQKKHRDEEDAFIAEGPKLVSELLESKNAELDQLFAAHEWLEKNEEFLLKKNVIEIDERELERISLLKTPNQVLAVFKKFKTNPLSVKDKVSLVLDGIQDPGNMGTIIRTADWFGISQIICSNDCADIYNPKVVQATMGSIARVSVIYTDLPEWLREQGTVRIYAATLLGKDVTKMNKIHEGLLIIGNESKGIHEDVLRFANEKITIPKKGNADSLNAAMATGIILSHLV